MNASDRADAVAFKMAEVFPADDLIAEWVATIAIAFNDLALIHSQMEADGEGVEKQHRFFYWLRIAISHFAEAASYLAGTSEIPEIAGRIDSLSESARDYHATCVRIYRENESVIEQIRNTTAFHYAELRTRPRRGLVHEALERLADDKGVFKGGTVREARMLFADDIVGHIFVRPTGWDGLDEVHTAISGGIDAFMRFANPLLTAYMEEKARAGIRFERAEQAPDGSWRTA